MPGQTDEELIEALDTGIFRIESQSSPDDRLSLLRIHRFIRNWKPGYGYLEIGSYRGGTLLPHVVDGRCRAIVSIDKRPGAQPDERGQMYSYEGLSTDVMIGELRPHVSLDGLRKVTTFDADASKVSPYAIGGMLDYVLIDGEHTNVAAFSDFFALLPSLREDAIVAFHDTDLISDAIKNVQTFLSYSGIAHRLFCLLGTVSVIALRGSIGPAAEALSAHAQDERSYLRDGKRRLREEIARAVYQGLHLTTP